MQTRTEGIVLKSMEYGEADLIVTYLTADLGIRKGFAKSSRKIRSRFGGSLEPFTHSRITLLGKEDASLPRLTQSDIIYPFQGLREDYNCFVRLCQMAELTLSLIEEGVPNKPVFDFLLLMMRRMQDDCSVLGALIYRVRLLKMKGYAPHLSACSRCSADSAWFHPSVGSVVCDKCAMVPSIVLPQDRKLRLPVSQGAAKLYEAVSGWELDKTARLKASPAILAELGDILSAHIQYLLAKPLRTEC